MDDLPAGWKVHRPPPVTPEPPEPAVADIELPADWEALEDHTGAVYYHNLVSGQTTWELPVSTAPDGSPLPPGWKAHKSPSDGSTYYYDSIRGTTTWDVPTAGGGRALSSTPSPPKPSCVPELRFDGGTIPAKEHAASPRASQNEGGTRAARSALASRWEQATGSPDHVPAARLPPPKQPAKSSWSAPNRAESTNKEQGPLLPKGDAQLQPAASSNNGGAATRDTDGDDDVSLSRGALSGLFGEELFVVLRHTFARCPPRMHELLGLISRRAQGAATSVGVFMDGTIAYALSKTWHDLLSTFVFGLHPMPFCGGGGEQPCTDPAPASDQFVYAACFLVVGAVIRYVTETAQFRSLPGFDTIPAMVGMCAGWAFGDAFLQLLVEVKLEYPGLCKDAESIPAMDAGCLTSSLAPDCTFLEMGMATLLLAAASVLIVALQPFTKNIDFGDGKFIDTLEDILEVVWSLLSKAVTTTVMVVWTWVARSSNRPPSEHGHGPPRY